MSVTLELAATDAEADRSGRPAPRSSAGLRSLRRFLPFLRPYRAPLIAANVLAIVTSSTAIVIPLVIARVVDGPIARRDFAALLAPVALIFVLGAMESFGMWGRRWLVSKPSTLFEIRMRAKLFAQLQALAIGRHDGWQSGQLLSRAIDDLAVLRRFVAFAGPFLIVNGVLLPIGLAALFVMNWQVGLIFTVVSLPLTVVCARFVRRFEVASRRSQDQAGDLATIAQESAQGVRVLKALGRGAFFGARFTALSRELQRTELEKVRLDATLWASLVALPTVAIAVSLGVGGHAVAQGTMTMGTLVASITLATFLQWPIIWMGFLLSELFEARTAADRYWEIIDTPLDITDPPHPVDLPAAPRGELVIDHVRFAYPTGEDGADKAVLEDISLRIRPGETVALVGATGSGKTALLELVPRLYDVDSGRITIDGIDIATLRLAELRRIVTVAFEEPVLFSASVRENVALGDPRATDADVRQALDIAQASEFVDALPWGLDTRIGEQGMSLSGGQRQRLALARAVLIGETAAEHGRIMVLDDPLSALDVETEERVQDRLRTVLSGATTLLVAHRPSTAALADRVALLADGRIVAEGTHEKLLRSNSRYRELMGGES
ncbi:ABC transporter ATP-binding protein [Nocardia asteroides]|uniref:ABC transporter ATP-binding protein n=1 Tax=Nocardia asteroides TaxID=1824 RepID=UPI001E33BD72|nr:ABC transporter ATP-binding protein [Nocardia asteroides]UGT52815.1 ABC transporter ATP-binding protein/permease [Nocardia asteroides]